MYPTHWSRQTWQKGSTRKTHRIRDPLQLQKLHMHGSRKLRDLEPLSLFRAFASNLGEEPVQQGPNQARRHDCKKHHGRKTQAEYEIEVAKSSYSCSFRNSNRCRIYVMSDITRCPQDARFLKGHVSNFKAYIYAPSAPLFPSPSSAPFHSTTPDLVGR